VFDGGDGLAEECVNEFVGSLLTVRHFSGGHSHGRTDEPPIQSFFGAVFISLFMLLSHSILTRRFYPLSQAQGTTPNAEEAQPSLGKASIPFNVSLLFSSFSLVFILIALVISLWGIVTTSMRRLEHRPPSLVQVHLHLLLSRQLQLSAIVTFVLPFMLLSFYTFSAIAFPIVLLVFMLVVCTVVGGCVVYRVPIGLESVSDIVMSAGQGKMRRRGKGSGLKGVGLGALGRRKF
jgi:hypothetical protein